jgi:hypothetical protein
MYIEILEGKEEMYEQGITGNQGQLKMECIRRMGKSFICDVWVPCVCCYLRLKREIPHYTVAIIFQLAWVGEQP